MDEAEFSKPASLDEALKAFVDNEGAAALSGGATLVAMLNADLVAPSTLVSLKNIPELESCERLDDGSVRIGAMRRHYQTAEETDFRDGQKVVSSAASQIANPPIRNMGTIGGSVAFFDPAADYPVALRTADAVIETASANGKREIPAADFFVDWYETALEPGELITAVRIPPAPDGSFGIYHKLARVTGDFATVSVGIILAMSGNECSALSITVGGCGPTPVRLPDAEKPLIGSALEADKVAVLGAALAEVLDPVDDVRASADYRRKVAPRMVARAIEEAKEELGGKA
jgi:carbon-monoxide dehydrogenase medium subunit